MLGQASPVVLINVERITIMKKIMMNIKAQVKRFTEFYANAMTNYGEALINSRGLAGA
jgi:hypothetical protein